MRFLELVEASTAGSGRQTSVKKPPGQSASHILRGVSRGKTLGYSEGEEDPDFTPICGLRPPRRQRTQLVRETLNPDTKPDENDWGGADGSNARLLALADEAGGTGSSGGVPYASAGHCGGGHAGVEGSAGGVGGGVPVAAGGGWMAGGWQDGQEVVGASQCWVPLFKPAEVSQPALLLPLQ